MTTWPVQGETLGLEVRRDAMLRVLDQLALETLLAATSAGAGETQRGRFALVADRYDERLAVLAACRAAVEAAPSTQMFVRPPEASTDSRLKALDAACAARLGGGR
jgi:hypothetical protein